MKRPILYICGWIFLIFAVIGVVLPILPTTPFVILAAFCFSHSSKKLNSLLMRSPFFGPYIKNYKTKEGIKLSLKIRSICTLWILLIMSAFFLRNTWIYILFGIIGIGVTIHLLSIKTKKDEKKFNRTTKTRTPDSF